MCASARDLLRGRKSNFGSCTPDRNTGSSVYRFLPNLTRVSSSDVFSIEKRSAVMSRIRSRGNRDTELRLIGLFRLHEVRGWRRGQRVFGKPDFVFRRERIAVFVDG